MQPVASRGMLLSGLLSCLAVGVCAAGTSETQSVKRLGTIGEYAVGRQPTEVTHELFASGYYMISLPLVPVSATPHALFCDDLGDGNYYMWRWEAGGYQLVPTSPPGCQTTTLSTEQGYWLLAAAATLDVTGTPRTGDQVLPLRTGWNMVAAPFEATMDSLQVDKDGDVRSLAEAQTAGWVMATFYYSHDGTGSYSTLTIGEMPQQQLSLWFGYWVLAGSDCSLIVPLPGGRISRIAASGAAAAPRPIWAFDILASTAGSVDSVTIAAADRASEGFDGFALDKPKPPAAPSEDRLRMALQPRQLDKAAPMSALRELQTETKGAVQETAEWAFSVGGGVEGGRVTLSWPALGRLPKDRVAILTDRDAHRRVFMRTQRQYGFTAPGAGGMRRFAITVRRARRVATLVRSFWVTPMRSARGAELTWTLAEDATVDITVLNAAGRLVQQVRNGLVAEAGRHTVTWDGRSPGGTSLPSGAYLCVLSVNTPDGQRARAVRPISLGR